MSGLSFDLWYPHSGRKEPTPTSHYLSFDIHTIINKWVLFFVVVCLFGFNIKRERGGVWKAVILGSRTLAEPTRFIK